MPSRRAALAEVARRVAAEQAASPPVPAVRVFETVGDAACLLQVFDKRVMMPTAARTTRPRSDRPREECRAVILDVVGAAGVPLPAKAVLRELRAAGLAYGASTVVKALAELTAAGQLVNPGDKRGYRLPEWGRPDVAPTFGQEAAGG